MITYEMIEKKIDRLIEQGAWIFYDYDLESYVVGNIMIDERNIFANEINVGKYMAEINLNKNKKLFEKLEKLESEQDINSEQAESKMKNYLEN